MSPLRLLKVTFSCLAILTFLQLISLSILAVFAGEDAENAA